MVGRRLSRLSDDANATLRTAAVVGREFDVDLVAEVAEVSEDDVLAHVELAMAARLVERGQRRARAHELLARPRAVHARRRAEHDAAGCASTRQIGEALERRGDASAAELAHHFAEGAQRPEWPPRRSSTRCERPRGARALSPTTRSCTSTISRWRRSTRTTPTIGRAPCCSSTAGTPSTRREMRTRMRPTRWPAPRSPVEVGDPGLDRACRRHVPGGPRALGRAPRSGRRRPDARGPGRDRAADDPTRAYITAALANALVLVPGDEALVLAEEAEALAREVGDARSAVRRAQRLVVGAARPGRSAEVCRVSAVGVEHAVDAARPDWELSLRYLLGEGLVEAGDFEAAAVEYERAGSVRSVLFGWAPVVFEAAGHSRRDGSTTLSSSPRAPPTGARARRDERRDRLGAAVVHRGGAGRGRRSTRAGGPARPDAPRHRDRLPDARARGDRRPWARVRRTPAGSATSVRWSPRSSFPGCSKPRPSVAYAGERRRSRRDSAMTSRRTPVRCSVPTPRCSAPATSSSVASRSWRIVSTTPSSRRAAPLELGDRLGLRSPRDEHRVDLARALLARDEPGDADRARALLAEALEIAEPLGLVAAARPTPAPCSPDERVRGWRGPPTPDGRGSGSGCGPRGRATRGARRARSPCSPARGTRPPSRRAPPG